MKVFNNHKEVTDIPLSIENIKFENVILGESNMSLPLIDNEILKSVECLVYDIILKNEPDWMHPDFKKSKLSLLLNTESENIDICLVIEAIPPKYTDEEKNNILRTANITNIDGWSEYEQWKMIFNSTEAWHSKENNCGEICTYQIELTQEEKDKLLWSIIQYLK